MLRPALLLTLAATATLAADRNAPAAGTPPPAPAARAFETRLTPDNRARQVLSRLTFGPRPGDFDQVRKLGVEKWIEQQLHPDRIPENPVLADRLKPLESLRLDPAEIVKKYYPQFPPGVPRPMSINDILTQDQIRQVFNGTAEERRAAIMKLDDAKRMTVLAQLGPNVLEGLPDLQKLQESARKMRQEMQQAEFRKLRPPLNELLAPDQVRIANRGTAAERAALWASLDSEKLAKVAASLPPNAVDDQPAMRRMGYMSRQPQQVVQADAREAKLYRAIYSNRQLEEVLTDFWFNHFNVYVNKDRLASMLASYEQDAIRPHVFGKFQDLLLATAKHPAMLYYLDNWQSMSPDVFQIGPFAPGPFITPQQLARNARGLNENYGRELMELHTLGVNGGYTQEDVVNVARCFTGWTIRNPNVKPEYTYAAFMHDTGEKTVLGHKIAAGGGEQDGVQVVEILAHHPSTARFIATKLARHFVADDPPPALVDRMARTFLKTGGDLRAVYETMFTSREFFSEGAWTAKVKSPLEVVVSAVRALDGEATDTFVLAQKVADMGEPLYGKEFPTGYKDTAEAWLSTANVIARINFANALVNGDIHGVKAKVENKDPNALAKQLLGRDPMPQTAELLARNPAKAAAVVMSAPDFQRR